ncbi:MAG: hypothetical protein ACHP9Y_00515 [Gammaproteobacteria bacterium]
MALNLGSFVSKCLTNASNNLSNVNTPSAVFKASPATAGEAAKIYNLLNKNNNTGSDDNLRKFMRANMADTLAKEGVTAEALAKDEKLQKGLKEAEDTFHQLYTRSWSGMQNGQSVEARLSKESEEEARKAWEKLAEMEKSLKKINGNESALNQATDMAVEQGGPKVGQTAHSVRESVGETVRGINATASPTARADSLEALGSKSLKPTPGQKRAAEEEPEESLDTVKKQKVSEDMQPSPESQIMPDAGGDFAASSPGLSEGAGATAAGGEGAAATTVGGQSAAAAAAAAGGPVTLAAVAAVTVAKSVTDKAADKEERDTTTSSAKQSQRMRFTP